MSPLRAFVAGHRVILLRLWEWIMAGEQWNKLWRALGLLIGLGTLYRIASAAPILMTPATVIWCAVVVRVASRETVANAAAEDSAEPSPVPPLGRDELAFALQAIGAPHAHLSALADHLGTTPARVREGCALAGVPIAGGVRMKGRGVSTGIKAADFPPLPSPTEAPSEPVVVAGQDATTTATGPQVKRREWGLTITDLADRHRQHKVPRAH
jgi:hypothetical protein